MKCSCDRIHLPLLFTLILSYCRNRIFSTMISWSSIFLPWYHCSLLPSWNIFYLDIILLPWGNIFYLDIIFLPWGNIFFLDIILLPWSNINYLYHFTAVMEHFLPWYHFTTLMEPFSEKRQSVCLHLVIPILHWFYISSAISQYWR